MSAKVWFIVGCALCVTLGAGAQEIGEMQFFPGVARLAGEPPSQWVSDVTVANLHDYTVTIGFIFFPEKTAHGIGDMTIPSHHRFRLGPRKTRMFEDVLRTVFGITKNTKGALLVTCSDSVMGTSNGEDTFILATMRTYDVSSPVGTYGQTIPATDYVANTSGLQSFVTGARNDDRFRSNLGIVNSSLKEVTVHYRIMNANATILSHGALTLPSLSVRQWSFNQLGVGTVSGPLTADLWLDPADVNSNWCRDMFDGGTGFVAYVSKVDSDTQDAEFMYAAPAWVAEEECK